MRRRDPADCAPGDATAWQVLPFSFRDADGDGAVISDAGSICSGAALPAGFLTTAPTGRPFDCNDSAPAISVALTVFADADGDGFGAGAGQAACTSGTPPPGFVLDDTDCDDGDPKAWASLMYRAVDFDGDGFTVPAFGVRCTGDALAPPYFATATGDDCDDTDPTRWATVSYHGEDQEGDGFTVPAAGALCTDGRLPPPFVAVAHGLDCDDHDPALTGFVVLYPDHDGDGVGAPPRQIPCIGATLPAGLVAGGYDEADDDPTVIETDDDDLLTLLAD